jgi:hypothetical protein
MDDFEGWRLYTRLAALATRPAPPPLVVASGLAAAAEASPMVLSRGRR